MSSSTAWYEALTEWIRHNGGEIHPSLDLDVVDEASRGIRAKSNIEKGELLIRLPGKLALDGSSLPLTFTVETSAHNSNNAPSDAKSMEAKRTASPWLRCLTYLLIQSSKHKRDDNGSSKEAKPTATIDNGDIDFGPYLDSLPDTYDTLLDSTSWPDYDMNVLLAGTSLGTMVQEERRNDMLQQRYKLSIKPYLQHVGVWTKDCDDENNSSQFRDFKQACVCVSTRGFHLQQQSDGASPIGSSQPTTDGPYSGPYLLPFVDLLNHSTENKCTTLQRDTKDGTFTMIAERPIKAGEEIFHAYGTELSPAQLLQTFGFVETGAAERAADNQWGDNGADDSHSNSQYSTTPGTITAKSVLNACRSVINSSFSKELNDTMLRLDIPDETWNLPSAERDILSYGLISDDILVSSDKPLSDDLVTLCCLLFLPDDVYDEWASEPCLWSADVLKDYFLGKLALRALMKVIGAKMEEYTAIGASACGLHTSSTDGEQQNGGGNEDPDVSLLRRLLSADSKDIINGSKRTRAIYALTIRLEEKHCIRLLKKEAINILRSLDDDGGLSEDEDSEEGGDDESGKRSSTNTDGGTSSSSKKMKL